MPPVITLNAVDYLIIGAYISVMILVGFSLKKYMKTGEDFFLSGRSLPVRSLRHLPCLQLFSLSLKILPLLPVHSSSLCLLSSP